MLSITPGAGRAPPMPELPEVERAARRLRRAVVGRRIVALELLHPSLVRSVAADAARSLAGRTIVAVEQRAKHQLLRLDDGRALHAHFRMAGDWTVARSEGELPRHTRAFLDLDDGTRVALVDPRALATITVLTADATPFDALGPDPFSPTFTAGWLRTALATRTIAIKPALLDQRVAAGVGNIYAAEALWEARIDPRARAASLGPKRLTALVEAIRLVLRRARGSRRRYAEGGDGPFNVYGREGLPCPRCGAAIRRIVQAGRSTYYCPRCQRR